MALWTRTVCQKPCGESISHLLFRLVSKMYPAGLIGADHRLPPLSSADLAPISWRRTGRSPMNGRVYEEGRVARPKIFFRLSAKFTIRSTVAFASINAYAVSTQP